MPTASFEPYAPRPITRRARWLMPYALEIIQQRAIREGRLKSVAEMRREAWAWRLCGHPEVFRRFMELANA